MTGGGARELPVATEDSYLQAAGRDDAGRAHDREVLSFRLADELYGIDVTSLREIVIWRGVTEVPRVPRFVRGIIAVRGDVVPVIDLRRRLDLGAAEPTRRARVLIAAHDGDAYGLLADEVRGVVRLPLSAIDPPPLPGPELGFVAGLARAGDDLLALLDVPSVVSFSLEEGR